MQIEMETALAETIEPSKLDWIKTNMTPEIYFIGITLAILGALVGVIWKMLHSKIDTGQKAMVQAHRETEQSLKESIKSLEISLNARSTEQYGQISNRLSNGSTRMDSFSQELA